MLPLPQQTSKQQRTFGSFYLAVDQPLPRPFRHRLRLDLLGLLSLAQTYLHELLAHGHGLACHRIRHGGLGKSG
ncbi:hypothetical protein D3C86_2107510 [compost metagenome]